MLPGHRPLTIAVSVVLLFQIHNWLTLSSYVTHTETVFSSGVCHLVSQKIASVRFQITSSDVSKLEISLMRKKTFFEAIYSGAQQDFPKSKQLFFQV